MLGVVFSPKQFWCFKLAAFDKKLCCLELDLLENFTCIDDLKIDNKANLGQLTRNKICANNAYAEI